jgi:ABC-type bacteriocin/lantibiotic exporter with double-glycine peptidase domain
MVHHTQRGNGHEELFARLPIVLGSALLLMGLVMGCTGTNFAELRPGLETRGSYIEGVPFYQQSEPICGPAALAGILDFRGRPESLERITEKIYHPGLGCALPADMEEYARTAGLKAASHKGSLGELKAYVRKGMPVICMIDRGYGLNHDPQYITVIGYDDVHEVVIVHDGLAPNSLIGYKKFNKGWVRAGYWMLVIEPKQREAR